MERRYDAVLFDLLTALLDSWTLWDRVAGSVEAGRRWRAAYLRITYGCGAYRPYETLVAEAARETGGHDGWAGELARRWDELAPWPDAPAVLAALGARVPLAVVTNCSETLGRRAAELTGGRYATVVTAERAGWYKPDERPYRLALEELGVAPQRVLFVAGSAWDLVGTAKLGMPTCWHNRAGLAAPPGAPPPLAMSDRLAPVLDLV